MLDTARERRPWDPPWRRRAAHRSLPPDVAAMLRQARLARGWTKSAAAGYTRVSRRMLTLLEQGQRRPSIVLAESLAQAYRLDPEDSARLMQAAVHNAGRDSPYRNPANVFHDRLMAERARGGKPRAP
jgi:transcriptional regulator with XRE-family HTH domain